MYHAFVNSTDGDGWGDDEDNGLGSMKREVIGTYRVKRDYIPHTNDHLTLLAEDLVYVFSKNVPGQKGFWEGETKGIVGIFPAEYVGEAKSLDAEIRTGGMHRLTFDAGASADFAAVSHSNDDFE